MIGRSIGRSVAHSLATPRIAAGGGAAYDTDAQTYITAVESADGQSLETGVKDAINAFVVGCKSDGIWAAIKASCILAGARTLSGALVPLVGTAPTNNNFVSGDYSRTAGLTGNGSTKYLGSNRANNADPQDNQHLSVFVTTFLTATAYIAGAGQTNSGATNIGYAGSAFFRSRNGTSNTIASSATGLVGLSRSGSTGYTVRIGEVSTFQPGTSQTPVSSNLSIFNSDTSPSFRSGSTLAFYSIGESLDLADLDTRVTTLITDIGTALA